jgi:hypothetical protein
VIRSMVIWNCLFCQIKKFINSLHVKLVDDYNKLATQMLLTYISWLIWLVWFPSEELILTVGLTRFEKQVLSFL